MEVPFQTIQLCGYPIWTAPRPAIWQLQKRRWSPGSGAGSMAQKSAGSCSKTTVKEV